MSASLPQVGADGGLRRFVAEVNHDVPDEAPAPNRCAPALLVEIQASQGWRSSRVDLNGPLRRRV